MPGVTVGIMTRGSGKTGTEGGSASAPPAFGGLQGVLPYRTNVTIKQPATVALENDRLVWAVAYPSFKSLGGEYDAKKMDALLEALDRPFTPRPVEGCLEDLLSLASAVTPAGVLAFARRRGPLGINPFVCLTASEREDSRPGDPGTTVQYSEEAWAYVALAKSAALLVHTAQELRGGLPVDVAEFRRLFPDKTGDPRIHLHEMNQNHAGHWARAATTKIGVVMSAPSAHPSMTGDSYFSLDFGEWMSGLEWDGAHQKSREEVARLRIRGRGGWPAVLCSPDQRPSALFNVLAFQLLAAISLPAQMYLCAECGRMFSQDYQPGRRRPKRNANAYCSEECRYENGKKRDRERKRGVSR